MHRLQVPLGGRGGRKALDPCRSKIHLPMLPRLLQWLLLLLLLLRRLPLVRRPCDDGYCCYCGMRLSPSPHALVDSELP